MKTYVTLALICDVAAAVLVVYGIITASWWIAGLAATWLAADAIGALGLGLKGRLP
jgi:uncharacterized ion transporter superfamily protein YfcC